MKKQLLLVAGIMSCSAVFSQQMVKPKGGTQVQAIVIPVEFHGVTGNLIDYVEPDGTVNEITKTKKVGYHPKNDWGLNESVNPNALPNGEDRSLQKVYTQSSGTPKALTYSWDGITNFNVSPADPSVDVGPNHVVQMTNGPSGAYIRIYDKTGNPIGSQVYFDNFMGMPGGLGDPIVLYDERADRWLLSEFSSSGNNMHVAISTTADPSGTYYTYTFNSPGGFPDYPKYSIWDDEYIITANVGSSDIYALDRTSLLAGTAANAQMFTMSNYGTIGFQAATPVSLNGMTAPPSGAPAMVMRMRDDAWAGSPNDALEVWNVDIDWVTPTNSSMTQDIVLPMNNPFDSELCGYTSFSCIDQPGSNTNLDPLREVLMNRIHYRNFGTHESIVCCHVTDVTGNDDAGIRWYELRRSGGMTGSWSIYQEGTYAPDSDSRWMPTIGISATGNIGLAYNVSSATTYPSIRYTGRKECDPLNTMTEPETVIVDGTTNNGSNRYGDYNAMGLDPVDGETFYMTGMYNPNTSGSTRIAAFNIPVCQQDPEVMFNATTITVNEPDADVVSGCLDYIDINIPMSIGVDPSQNADITVIITGGTATQGEDYDLLGGTFTFGGGTLTGSATLRVYNDNYVEGDETVNIGYTLNANGGDAYSGATNQSVVVTIIDDDLDPTSMVNTVVVMTQDFEGGMAPFTTDNPAGGANEPFQIGDAAAASSGAFTVPATNASQIAWINDDACDCDQNDVNLTSQSFDLTGFTAANLSFNTYYENNEWNGDQEIASVEVSTNGGAFNQVYLLPSASWSTLNVDLTPYVGNSDVRVNFHYTDAGGWLYGWAIDDVVVTGDGPLEVQTIVNSGSGMTANLGPNGTVHFYDPTSSRVMMTLENSSSFDYGCVTVDVDRDGSTPTALEFNTTNVADYLHSKTFTVTPANNNPTGTYNMTVYYEEAEVAAWEAMTGNSRNNAEIIKVAGNNQIDDVTPATAGSYSISNVPATLGAFNSDVTFTSSFATGFSGFGVGIYNAANNPPTANFSASTTSTCMNVDIQFTDLSGGTPTTWDWDFGDGIGTSNQPNPTYAYPNPGTYNVTLTVTNAYGTDAQTINSYIVITNGVTSSQNINLCVGGSVTVGTSTYNSAGSYTDVLQTGEGCDSTVTTNITMDPPITSTQNVAICPGESVTVGTSTYTGAGSYTDVLQTSQGCDSTITTNVNMLSPSSYTQDIEFCQGGSVTVGSSTYNTTGTYTDVVPNAAGCDSTITTNLTVNPLPSVSIDPTVIDTICSGSTGTISLIGTPNGGTFSGAGVTGTTFDPSSLNPGTHIITYTYTDLNGCVGTNTVAAVIEDCSGVDDVELDGVILAPNPSDGIFNIIGMDLGTDFEIYDSRGRLILDGQIESTSEEVAIPNVEAGSYYLHGFAKGRKGSLKFIVIK